MRKPFLLAAVVATVGVTATRAEAQTDVATATLAVGPLLFLEFDVAELDLDPTATDVPAGSRAGATSAAATESCVRCRTTIESDPADMAYADSLAPPVRPSTEPRRSANGGEFTGLTTATRDVTSFATGSNEPAVPYERGLQRDEDPDGASIRPITHTVAAP